MSLKHFGRGALRVARNYTKGYTDVQAKVRDATSNDPWGPSGTQMNEIAQMTYNQQDFVETIEILDKRLNDKGKNWRHVSKSLTLLDYLLRVGSENVVLYFRENLYVIKTLKEFQYIDGDMKDQGTNVREKAEDITNLLVDESRLRDQRRSRAFMRDRMLSWDWDDAGGEQDEDEGEREHSQNVQRRRTEDDELGSPPKKPLDESNTRALFDDHAQPNSPHHNPFPPVGATLRPQQHPVHSQFSSNSYRQRQAPLATQRQQQPHLQQLQIQQARKEEWMRQQLLLQQQQQQQKFLQQQQQAQQASLFTAGPIQTQPTGYGSNNPFALAAGTANISSPPPPVPSFQSTPAFNSFGNGSSSLSPAPEPPRPSSAPQAPPSPTTANTLANAGRPNVITSDKHAELNNRFANKDDGVDSFGDFGNLRFGHHYAGQLGTQKTGTNNPSSAKIRSDSITSQYDLYDCDENVCQN